MATTSTPSCTISESTEKRKTGSGVVNTGANVRVPYSAPSVPMIPAFFPAAFMIL